MKAGVITLFPATVDSALSESIVGRTRSAGLLELSFFNPKDFAADARRTVDDRPYGGGTGMVMMAEPVYKAWKKAWSRGALTVLLSPRGKPFTQELAWKLAKRKKLIFICGHYEGIDERLSGLADMEVSIGDYVLTGGELAAAVILDSVARLLPGALKKPEAVRNETFAEGLLEAPHYTRPAVWRGKRVPRVLTEGNHALIEKWRAGKALALTSERRPDLLESGYPPLKPVRQKIRRKHK